MNKISDGYLMFSNDISFQTEIAGRFPNYQMLIDRGRRLTAQLQSSSDDEINEHLEDVEKTWNALNDTWEKQKLILTQQYDLQVSKIILVIFEILFDLVF